MKLGKQRNVQEHESKRCTVPSEWGGGAGGSFVSIQRTHCHNTKIGWRCAGWRTRAAYEPNPPTTILCGWCPGQQSQQERFQRELLLFF